MAKKKKNIKSVSSYPAIVTVDPFSSISYRYESGSAKANKTFKKSDFFISYISAKEALSGTIELSKNIPEVDIGDAIEIKAYEDLGLDTSINYKIKYTQLPTSEAQSNNTFNVFAVNSDAMVQSFSKATKKVPYIDYITTAPFLIKSLYQKDVLELSGNECFIYFHKYDAFLAIYQNGEYLYSRSLRYSLSEIGEKFSSLTGERMNEDAFYNLLRTEGLKSSNMNYQQQFMKLFGEIFLYINDIAVFAKRSCNIAQIDRIYVGTEIGIISGMNEYVKSYMGSDAKDFNFGLRPGEKNSEIDQIHLMLILTAQVYLESGSADNELNFTIYQRPPSLDKRPAGKFLGVVAAALVLSLAYPAFQYGYGYFKHFQYLDQQKEFSRLNPIATDLKNKIAKLTEEDEIITATLAEENNVLKTREALLEEIHKKRVEYPMKIVALTELIGMVNKNNVKLEKIVQLDRNIVLSLIGSNEKHFTELMEQIAKTGKFSIRTKEIIKDVEKKIYRSDITMEIL